MQGRVAFVEQLNGIIGSIHDSLSGGREKLVISYEPDISAEVSKTGSVPARKGISG